MISAALAKLAEFVLIILALALLPAFALLNVMGCIADREGQRAYRKRVELERKRKWMTTQRAAS